MSRRIAEGGHGDEAGDTGEATGRDVEAAGALARQATAVAEPAEGAVDNPAPLQHNEALLIRALLDSVMTYPVQMAPLSAPLGCKGAVQVARRRPVHCSLPSSRAVSVSRS